MSGGAGAPQAVTPDQVRPLRASVLRPGQPASALIYPGDEDPRSGHLAVRLEGVIVGVATVMADRYPAGARPGDWRIRGMAVEPARRGGGIGSALLDACEEHARHGGGSRLWCNARIDARNLYQRIGMGIEGEQFEITGIGTHFLMSKTLD